MDLDETLEEYHEAADAFSRGDPTRVKALYSQRDDVTLANPFGPAVSGWDRVSSALDYASSRFRDGEVGEFDYLARYESDDLATLLAMETWRARVGDAQDVAPFHLRVSTTFRREDGAWKLVHRHADPITTRDESGPLRAT